MPDHWTFFRRWIRERGIDEPLASLGFDFHFAVPGFSTLARRLGSVPASQANAARLLERGDSVIVYPGGDEHDYRPWTERHRVDLHGRMGFVRLALREQEPIDWRHLGCEAADDPEVVRRCYDEIVQHMHIRARLGDPLRRASRARGTRP